MKRRFSIGIFLILLLFLALAPACEKITGQSRETAKDAAVGEQIYNLPAIELTDAEQAFVLRLARAAVLKQPIPKGDAAVYPSVYEKQPRGVFLSMPRPGKPALTGFGWGETVAAATVAAGKDLKQLAADENPAERQLRVDVIRSSDKRKTHEVKVKWSIPLDHAGLLFQTEPVVAMLPEELRDRGIIDPKGRFSTKRFKVLMNDRGMPREVLKQVQDSSKLKLCRFTTISFMEDGQGGIWPLWRGNRMDLFDPTPENLLRTIKAAGDYLKNNVKADGSFNYRYQPQWDLQSTSYNELRHAGTTFSMLQVYDVTRDPEMLEAARRALGWIERNSFGPDETDRQTHDWVALNNDTREYAKMGGSGLSLLAFGWYTKVTGDRQYLPLMQKFARFIEYMIKDNGDIQMRYFYRQKDKGKWVKPVLYYPGEAFFGLATLYGLDGNRRWIDLAVKGIDYIADVRDAPLPDTEIPPDHWLAYSINEVHKVEPRENQARHGWRIFNAMHQQFHETHEDPSFVGGYLKKPASVQAACRLEATGALYRLAEQLGDRQRMDQCFAVLQKGSSYLMRTQYNEINTMFQPNPRQAMGGLFYSYWSPEIQIDYVQHSLSALLMTYQYTLEREKEKTAAASEAAITPEAGEPSAAAAEAVAPPQ